MITYKRYALVATRASDKRVYWIKESDNKQDLVKHPPEIVAAFKAKKEYKVQIVTLKAYIKK